MKKKDKTVRPMLEAIESPQVVRVTHSGDGGPGSLLEAFRMAGPGIIIFETSGDVSIQNVTVS